MESEALSIVSYIGCAISIVCLLFTSVVLIVLRWVLQSSMHNRIILIICLYRKQAFNQTQHFVHLNLSIALLLGLVTFVSGIQAATKYRVSYSVIVV